MNWSCPACALGVSVSPRATTCRPKTLTRILAFLALLLSLAACTEPAPEIAPVLRCGHRNPPHHGGNRAHQAVSAVLPPLDAGPDLTVVRALRTAAGRPTAEFAARYPVSAVGLTKALVAPPA